MNVLTAYFGFNKWSMIKLSWQVDFYEKCEKSFFFAVQIEKTEKNNLQKTGEEIFYF